MSLSLGIDTSNYTTSAALYDSESGSLIQERMLLPVKEGQLGLRQSDAVFHHVRQLPIILEKLAAHIDRAPDVVGVSTRPRPVDGSYMPCFEAGHGTARSLGAFFKAPVRCFSHQEGHIEAAVYSVNAYDSLGDRFVAFHVSGGTTEAVMAKRGGTGYGIEYLCGSLDLKAGQAVDRAANMLGLSFPGGKELDALSLGWPEDIRCRPVMRGMDCSLSGIENRCKKLIAEGRPPEYTARFCLCSIAAALNGMHDAIIKEYGQLPVIFAGGVASNTVIRRIISERTGALFALPEFSCDNAAGIAILAAKAFAAESIQE